MFLTALPFAVSVPLTSNEIQNFVTGSLPNGTVIQNVDTGQVAIIQNGEPAYLPYLSEVDPSLPVLFMTTAEILSYSGTAGELIQNTDNDKIVVVGSDGVPSYLPYLTEIDTSSLMEKPTATGSVGQVLTRANGTIPYTWADASTVDTSALMEKPTATGSVGQVLTRANGSVPYEWADAPSGSGGGFPQLVSSFMYSTGAFMDLTNPPVASNVVSHERTSAVGSAVLSSDFVEIQFHCYIDEGSLSLSGFSVYTSAGDVLDSLDILYNVVASPSLIGTTMPFDIKSGLIDLRNLSSGWSSLNYRLSGTYKSGSSPKQYRAYSILNFYKVM